MTAPTIVLTADRSLMSHFRGNYILGFLSCAPTDIFPDVVYDHLFAPPVNANLDGTAETAPLGLRRVESGLLSGGRFDVGDVAIAHPEHVQEVVGPGTEIVGITAMDPRGMGPVTSSFTHGTDRTPMNAVKFEALLEEIQRIPGDRTIVVGGGGAWQVDTPENRDRFGIDHVVQGEVGHRANEVFTAILEGAAPPTITPERPSSMREVPEIRGPTVNSLLEGMRGCGRSCEFCGPDMRRTMYTDVDRLEREARVNAAHGFDHLWLHGEDILLYEFEGRFEPNRAAVSTLFETLRAIDGIDMVGTTHVSLPAVVAAPELVEDIARINEYGPKRWGGVQPGIETASPRLIEKHMAAKPLPFEPEEWPRVVEEGFRILNDNYIYPAATLIVGLPGETEEDVRRTIDLVDRLDDTDSILAPLMFMDYESEDT
ncbi:MAG: radical SAM protein, partial [Halanaeroarchaeum sp.]